MLDLVVFGRAAGKHVKQSIEQGLDWRAVRSADLEKALSRLNRWNHNQKGESVNEIRIALQQVMQNDFGVFRSEENMKDLQAVLGFSKNSLELDPTGLTWIAKSINSNGK